MSESAMRQRVVKALKELDAFSVENRVGPGTPDVNYIEGWIELKKVDKWPKNSEVPLRLPHFRPVQRAWLRRRARRCGAVWLLLQVKNDWLLFAGDVAATLLGNATRGTLLDRAKMYWLGGLKEDELLRFLRKWNERGKPES